MKKKANEVIRVGDRVVVTEDKFIIRVGYPIIWKDLYWEVAESEELQAASRILGVSLDDHRVIKEIAHMKARKSKFGGNERQIIYYPGPDLVEDYFAKDGTGWLSSMNTPPKEEDYLSNSPYLVRNAFMRIQSESSIGKMYHVLRKRIAKTGTRFASYGYEDDWEPGGLEDERTHVILELSNGFEIEQIHVKKVI